VNTSRKTEKSQCHDVVSIKVPHTYDGVWCVCIFQTCSVYASCVKFYLWSANIFLVIITKIR